MGDVLPEEERAASKPVDPTMDSEEIRRLISPFYRVPSPGKSKVDTEISKNYRYFLSKKKKHAATLNLVAPPPKEIQSLVTEMISRPAEVKLSHRFENISSKKIQKIATAKQSPLTTVILEKKINPQPRLLISKSSTESRWSTAQDYLIAFDEVIHRLKVESSSRAQVLEKLRVFMEHLIKANSLFAEDNAEMLQKIRDQELQLEKYADVDQERTEEEKSIEEKVTLEELNQLKAELTMERERRFKENTNFRKEVALTRLQATEKESVLRDLRIRERSLSTQVQGLAEGLERAEEETAYLRALTTEQRSQLITVRSTYEKALAESIHARNQIQEFETKLELSCGKATALRDEISKLKDRKAQLEKTITHQDDVIREMEQQGIRQPPILRSAAIQTEQIAFLVAEEEEAEEEEDEKEDVDDFKILTSQPPEESLPTSSQKDPASIAATSGSSRYRPETPPGFIRRGLVYNFAAQAGPPGVSTALSAPQSLQRSESTYKAPPEPPEIRPEPIQPNPFSRHNSKQGLGPAPPGTADSDKPGSADSRASLALNVATVSHGSGDFSHDETPLPFSGRGEQPGTEPEISDESLIKSSGLEPRLDVQSLGKDGDAEEDEPEEEEHEGGSSDFDSEDPLGIMEDEDDLNKLFNKLQEDQADVKGVMDRTSGLGAGYDNPPVGGDGKPDPEGSKAETDFYKQNEGKTTTPKVEPDTRRAGPPPLLPPPAPVPPGDLPAKPDPALEVSKSHRKDNTSNSLTHVGDLSEEIMSLIERSTVEKPAMVAKSTQVRPRIFKTFEIQTDTPRRLAFIDQSVSPMTASPALTARESLTRGSPSLSIKNNGASVSLDLDSARGSEQPSAAESARGSGQSTLTVYMKSPCSTDNEKSPSLKRLPSKIELCNRALSARPLQSELLTNAQTSYSEHFNPEEASSNPQTEDKALVSKYLQTSIEMQSGLGISFSEDGLPEAFENDPREGARTPHDSATPPPPLPSTSRGIQCRVQLLRVSSLGLQIFPGGFEVGVQTDAFIPPLSDLGGAKHPEHGVSSRMSSNRTHRSYRRSSPRRQIVPTAVINISARRQNPPPQPGISGEVFSQLNSLRNKEKNNTEMSFLVDPSRSPSPTAHLIAKPIAFQDSLPGIAENNPVDQFEEAAPRRPPSTADKYKFQSRFAQGIKLEPRSTQVSRRQHSLERKTAPRTAERPSSRTRVQTPSLTEEEISDTKLKPSLPVQQHRITSANLERLRSELQLEKNSRLYRKHNYIKTFQPRRASITLPPMSGFMGTSFVSTPSTIRKLEHSNLFVSPNQKSSMGQSRARALNTNLPNLPGPAFAFPTRPISERLESPPEPHLPESESDLPLAEGKQIWKKTGARRKNAYPGFQVRTALRNQVEKVLLDGPVPSINSQAVSRNLLPGQDPILIKLVTQPPRPTLDQHFQRLFYQGTSLRSIGNMQSYPYPPSTKVKSMDWTRRIVGHIFHERSLADLKSRASTKSTVLSRVVNDSLGAFVFIWARTKYGLPVLAHRLCWTLILSVITHRARDAQIELFSQALFDDMEPDQFRFLLAIRRHLGVDLRSGRLVRLVPLQHAEYAVDSILGGWGNADQVITLLRTEGKKFGCTPRKQNYHSRPMFGSMTFSSKPGGRFVEAVPVHFVMELLLAEFTRARISLQTQITRAFKMKALSFGHDKLDAETVLAIVGQFIPSWDRRTVGEILVSISADGRVSLHDFTRFLVSYDFFSAAHAIPVVPLGSLNAV
eukprot:gnl/Chilomastix_cuspidata/197.p1 GENE.gnl/Chilomastix_cuspidata/197~~gnl/Chilomastix_cuspidata/197.p1  ORF type:complete len:1740 (-),score=513.86 gnl/Chilomastix_cuspidata/197:6889-12108(-)